MTARERAALEELRRRLRYRDTRGSEGLHELEDAVKLAGFTLAR